MTVEHKLACQRLATGVEGGVGRFDPSRAILQLWAGAAACHCVGCCRAGTRTIDEAEATIGAEEEALADVATGRAAILAIDWINLAVIIRCAAGCRNCRDEQTP